MKVLVVGSGAREHALAAKLVASPRTPELIVAPGNGGTAALSRTRNANVKADDVAGLLALANSENVDLTVVGPEAPLALGIVDAFTAAGRRIFGPNRRAARLESSKVYAKAFLSRNNIPTAPFHVSSRYDAAVALVRMMPTPVVVKASGLAAGKGVVVCNSVREAEEVLRRIMVDKAHDSAGDEVVLEAFLEGREVSLLAFVDGKKASPMPFACDYKRRDDGNRGPNTGGMGAYSPAGWLTPAQHADIMQKIYEPTIAALRSEDLDYRGVLYIGVMVTAAGPWVLEFNVRFGDPETQVILPRLDSDLLDIVEACVDGRLDSVQPRWSERVACGVVISARNYPHDGVTGVPFPTLSDGADHRVFHAGTARQPDGHLLASGGRLMTVVGLGDDMAQARQHAYDGLPAADLRAFHYRTDIAQDAALASV